MIEENVVAAAGVDFKLSLADMVRMIAGAGYRAVQRDCLLQFPDGTPDGGTR